MIAEISLAWMLLQSVNVAIDESVRYQQLAQLAETRAEAAETESETWEDGEWYSEPHYEDSGYYGGYDWQQIDESDGISAAEFEWLGVVEEDGVKYTWYSQNVLGGGGLDELNANGRHVEGGYVVDADGYIAVASSDYEKGTVLDTPFGAAKVYDTGCASGTIDVYTDF